MKSSIWLFICGIAAGILSGLLGTGGGMILISLLPYVSEYRNENLFPTCVSIMLPICIAGTFVLYLRGNLVYANAMPYLIGSMIGGLIAGLWGQKIPNVWLHRLFGLLVVVGGIRQLWMCLE